MTTRNTTAAPPAAELPASPLSIHQLGQLARAKTAQEVVAWLEKILLVQTKRILLAVVLLRPSFHGREHYADSRPTPSWVE